MKLRFHQAAVDLLPKPPKFSAKAAQALDRREKKLGIRFPAAVREWYSLEGADELLRKYSNADFPIALADLGMPLKNWYGLPSRDFVPAKLLLLMNENQGVANWAVRLEGGDDPEVVVEVDTAPHEVWHPHAETFSTFIYTRIWDWRDSPLGLSAQDTETGAADLEFLRAQFKEGPRTWCHPGRTNYRFAGEAGSILLWEGEGQTDWFLRAESEEALEALVRQVLDRGGLRTSLYGNDDRASTVLARLVPRK